MLGDLRLGDREFVNDRPDRLFSIPQRVENLATLSFSDRVEDVGRGGGSCHTLIIFP
jgi:hypothetical protein